MNNIQVSVVSYSNTIPFVYGIEKCSELLQKINVSYDVPSICASKLLDGSADIGLVPVAVIPYLTNHHVFSEYCIGAKNNVKSVILYSNKCLNEIECILLDKESRTSNMLTKVLAKYHWRIFPKWIDPEPNANDNCIDFAKVLIGDKALKKNNFNYSYDLATEWNKFTKTPFTFACWVASKNVDMSILNEFNDALSFGVKNIDKAILSTKQDFEFDIRDYLFNCIDYNFDDAKKKSIELFFKYIKDL